MVTATFIYRQRVRNAEFEQLDATIDEVATSSSGYLGRKGWHNDEGMRAVVYYWASMDDLRTFQKDATHRLAKSRYREWYEGYRFEIAEIQLVRGDALFADWPS